MDASTSAAKKEWIDPDDAPELSEAFFEQADVFLGEELIRAGVPRKAEPQSPP
jgi:hypothetical protein